MQNCGFERLFPRKFWQGWIVLKYRQKPQTASGLLFAQVFPTEILKKLQALPIVRQWFSKICLYDQLSCVLFIYYNLNLVSNHTLVILFPLFSWATTTANLLPLEEIWLKINANTQHLLHGRLQTDNRTLLLWCTVSLLWCTITSRF